MPLTRRAVLDGVVCVVAVGLVIGSAAAWISGPPHVGPDVLLTVLVATGLTVLGGFPTHGAAARDAAPMMAGIMLAVLGTDHGHDVWLLLAPWSLAVLVGYRVVHGSWRATWPRTAISVIAGTVAAGVMPLVDWGRGPYDRVLIGVTAFVIAHSFLERTLARRRRSLLGARVIALGCISLLYAAGLVLVMEQVADLEQRPWATIASAAAVVLAVLAVTQTMHIVMLTRVTDALTEASITMPWPPALIDSTAVRLISAHVRAASVSIEPTAGGPGTLSESLNDGSTLVVRRTDGDFSFSRYDARLVAGVAAMARASHDQASRESRLWTASVTDDRTGLWAYEHWRTCLRDLVRSRTPGQRLGVVFLDLDHFKQVNSEFGHLRADQLLATIGERLGTQCPGWRFGRFGGDEFVGLVPTVRDAQHLDEMCRQLAALIRQPVEADGITISVTGSIGRAFSADRSDTAESLVARSERDLRQRKAERAVPAAPIVAFNEDEILRRILDQGVDVAYQPIVDVQTRQLIGWEALLRGSLPLLGNLNPEQLVGSAVRAGVLDLVTRQLTKQALQTVSEASRRIGRPLSLSVNLEQEQFRDSSPLLRWLVEEADRDHVELTLELTERGDAADWGPREDALADRLASHGIGLALDDLGAGNSRLPLLIRRHWETVKLDRGLLLNGHRGLVMLTHTVAMLRSLGMPIVMEGVETAEQFELIQELGIDRVQGHYFAAASTAADLFAFVERHGLDFSRITAPRLP